MTTQNTTTNYISPQSEYMQKLFSDFCVGFEKQNPTIEDFYREYINKELRRNTNSYATLIGCKLNEKEQKYLEIGSGLYTNVSKHLVRIGYDIELLTPCLDDMLYENAVEEYKNRIRLIAKKNHYNKDLVESLLTSADKTKKLSIHKGTCVTDKKGTVCALNYVDKDDFDIHTKDDKKPQIEDYDTIVLSPYVKELDIFKAIINNQTRTRVVSGFCTSENDKMLKSKLCLYKSYKKVIEALAEEKKNEAYIYDHQEIFKYKDGTNEEGMAYILVYDPIKKLNSER